MGLSRLNWRTDSSNTGSSFAEHLSQKLLISFAAAGDLIDFGSVYINGRLEQDPQKKLAGREEIQIYWPKGGIRRFYQINPDRILYRDSFLLVYDKEAGVPSQQLPADAFNNLYAAVQRFVKKESPKPYVALHQRLDLETSGVMLFALDRLANRKLSEAFKTRSVTKDYLVWVAGCPAEDDWISADDIGRKRGRYQVVPQGTGKSAKTVFKILLREKERSLLWARPKTGRTHQIRLHLAVAGHPVLGDRLYGKDCSGKLLLHAYRLTLSHPVTETLLAITAPIPPNWPPPHTLTLPQDPI